MDNNIEEFDFLWKNPQEGRYALYQSKTGGYSIVDAEIHGFKLIEDNALRGMIIEEMLRAGVPILKDSSGFKSFVDTWRQNHPVQE